MLTEMLSGLRYVSQSFGQWDRGHEIAITCVGYTALSMHVIECKKNLLHDLEHPTGTAGRAGALAGSTRDGEPQRKVWRMLALKVEQWVGSETVSVA